MTYIDKFLYLYNITYLELTICMVFATNSVKHIMEEGH